MYPHIDIFKIFKIDNTYSAHPVLIKVIVSSTYHFQKISSSFKTGTKDELSFWKRYVDDTITFIKTGSAEYVLWDLNSLHPNIELTYETEVNSKLAFLDVLLLREGQNIITTVCRKVTNSDILIGICFTLRAGNKELQNHWFKEHT